MHVWDGTPARSRNLDQALDFSIEPEVRAEAAPSRSQLLPDWRGILTVALVAVVGWPFINSATFHVMWAEMSRLLSLSRSKS
jgi:hypothetical protein